MYLSDLAYIDAAYDDTVETNAVESAGTIKEERQSLVHINWEKKRKEYCALKPIVDSQQHALVLATNVNFDCEFYAQFESIKLLNIDECYALSLKVRGTLLSIQTHQVTLLYRHIK
ncbi:hypothetical protein SARC_15533 [Sphaeroforma arctica JP610]|uniref:Uncharacterized protein n=1 Tax=Sphaeroforma arctica JP610 TaxID=667725 RepID=A0A0L0F5Q1_9EUKA|nr:hypothetical protein SARC_15533 [Sphaeroforma arctica JP610]KNC71921.1 hypothetical protein SARC_15533 [Sphaeroforma arctica JP610]|eukprot:XP_014145823.1 hypothetical protein SARC_15533 [Sphaeroforma arctica JP610]